MIVALSASNFHFKLLLMIFEAFLLHFLFIEQNNINVGLNLVYVIKGSFPISRTVYAELLEHWTPTIFRCSHTLALILKAICSI